MAESKPKDAEYKGLVKLLDEAQKLGKLGKDSEDPRGEIAEKARKELIKTAYDTGVALGQIDKNNVTLEAFQAGPNAETAIKGYFDYKLKDTQTYANNLFAKNLEKIVKEQVPAKSLEGIMPIIAEDKEVMQATSEKARKVLAQYSSLQSLAEIMKVYKEKGMQAVPDKGMREEIIGLAVKGASEEAKKKQKEVQKKRGYEDSKSVELAGSLAEIAVKLGYYDEKKVRKYALDGLEIERKRIEGEYKAEGMDAAGALRETLVTLGRGSAEQFNKSISLVYSAYKIADEEKKKADKAKKK